MFATLKQITAPTNKDLRKRIYFTLGALLIFIIGTNLRVPVAQTKNLTDNLGFLDLLNAMGGGALKNFSIFLHIDTICYIKIINISTSFINKIT